jgi:hypothetical protein
MYHIPTSFYCSYLCLDITCNLFSEVLQTESYSTIEILEHEEKSLLDNKVSRSLSLYNASVLYEVVSLFVYISYQFFYKIYTYFSRVLLIL